MITQRSHPFPRMVNSALITNYYIYTLLKLLYHTTMEVKFHQWNFSPFFTTNEISLSTFINYWHCPKYKHIIFILIALENHKIVNTHQIIKFHQWNFSPIFLGMKFHFHSKCTRNFFSGVNAHVIFIWGCRKFLGS